MKERILTMLRQAEKYISGQEMCERLEVSRTAVWKVMNQLKEEGYVIEAVPKKGYHMVSGPDTVTDYEIKSQLSTEVMGQAIHYYEEIDSTNIKAKVLAEEGAPHGTLVVAEQQCAGKGRRGRAWNSPKGSGIWMSLLLKPSIHPQNASMLTLVSALATVEGIKKQTGLEVKIKWPNDIILNKKKVCGILTEMSSELDYIHHIVIGTGMNINTMDFPEEIAEVATSLKWEGGKDYKRAGIIAATMESFEKYYELFLKTEDLSLVVDEYNQKLIHKDQEIIIVKGEEKVKAKALGIDKSGELMVELENGQGTSLRSGEISIRGIAGYV